MRVSSSLLRSSKDVSSERLLVEAERVDEACEEAWEEAGELVKEKLFLSGEPQSSLRSKKDVWEDEVRNKTSAIARRGRSGGEQRAAAEQSRW